MDDDRAGRAYSWLFAVSLAAGCAALLLIALYYWRNPDRHVLADFEPRVPPPGTRPRQPEHPGPAPGGVTSNGAAPSGADSPAGPGAPSIQEPGGMSS